MCLFIGVVTTTVTSPIWVVKTQMQLESGVPMKASRCIRQIYRLDGFRGFYRGLTASYAGWCVNVNREKGLWQCIQFIHAICRYNGDSYTLCDL